MGKTKTAKAASGPFAYKKWIGLFCLFFVFLLIAPIFVVSIVAGGEMVLHNISKFLLGGAIGGIALLFVFSKFTFRR